MKTHTTAPNDKGYRFPPEIISHAVIRWSLTSAGMVEGVVLFLSEGAWWQTTLVFHTPIIYIFDEGALLALPYDFQGYGLYPLDASMPGKSAPHLVYFFPHVYIAFLIERLTHRRRTKTG